MKIARLFDSGRLGLGRDPHCSVVGRAGEIGRKEIKGDRKEEVL